VDNSRQIIFNLVPSFTTERRERSDGQEDLVVFESTLSESGHSGGPVFGSGGGVVGVIIENWETGSRATSLVPLLRDLVFRDRGGLR
jgi:hypothetical protein